MTLVDRVCEQCGRAFASRWVGRFCSKPCKYAWTRAQPRKRTPKTCRRLRDDEPIPPSTPKRYDVHGYVVLRWRLGNGVYVEALEHRVVAGRTAQHTHHINGVKDDNRQENLKPLTPLDHSAEHARVDMEEAARLYTEGWGLKALGQKYGVDHVSIMRSLKRRGVQMRSLVEAHKFRNHHILLTQHKIELPKETR